MRRKFCIHYNPCKVKVLINILEFKKDKVEIENRRYNDYSPCHFSKYYPSDHDGDNNNNEDDGGDVKDWEREGSL